LAKLMIILLLLLIVLLVIEIYFWISLKRTQGSLNTKSSV